MTDDFKDCDYHFGIWFFRMAAMRHKPKRDLLLVFGNMAWAVLLRELGAPFLLGLRIQGRTFHNGLQRVLLDLQHHVDLGRGVRWDKKGLIAGGPL